MTKFGKDLYIGFSQKLSIKNAYIRNHSFFFDFTKKLFYNIYTLKKINEKEERKNE